MSSTTIFTMFMYVKYGPVYYVLSNTALFSDGLLCIVYVCQIRPCLVTVYYVLYRYNKYSPVHYVLYTVQVCQIRPCLVTVYYVLYRYNKYSPVYYVLYRYVKYGPVLCTSRRTRWRAWQGPGVMQSCPLHKGATITG